MLSAMSFLRGWTGCEALPALSVPEGREPIGLITVPSSCCRLYLAVLTVLNIGAKPKSSSPKTSKISAPLVAPTTWACFELFRVQSLGFRDLGSLGLGSRVSI